MKNIFFLIIIFYCTAVKAQSKPSQKKDSVVTINTNNFDKFLTDTAALRKYKPSIAIKRSAMLPGWGQYTNKKYWKIPLVYAGVGIPAYFFFRNLKQYREAKAAYANATDGDASNNYLILEPYLSLLNQPERILSFKTSVRQNVDYSVLFFIIFWGLNVADAAVDANLKTFDVRDDISLRLRGGYSPLAKTNGISLVLQIGK